MFPLVSLLNCLSQKEGRSCLATFVSNVPRKLKADRKRQIQNKQTSRHTVPKLSPETQLHDDDNLKTVFDPSFQDSGDTPQSKYLEDSHWQSLSSLFWRRSILLRWLDDAKAPFVTYNGGNYGTRQLSYARALLDAPLVS